MIGFDLTLCVEKTKIGKLTSLLEKKKKQKGKRKEKRQRKQSKIKQKNEAPPPS